YAATPWLTERHGYDPTWSIYHEGGLSMNIVEFQRYVSNFSKEKGFQDTTIEERAMYAMAELGELAEVILKRDKIQDSKREIEDNIVVWLPQYNILAGGCLVKSASSKDLGNVADAYVNEWSISIENVLKRYGNINSVVPGHGGVGDRDLLLHTLDLLK
ncbi:hypothetical protein PTB13_25945, partial [Bacillus sp. MHSD17]|nr:hypothetical protein [Bacillus sp. MHSD17]